MLQLPRLIAAVLQLLRLIAAVLQLPRLCPSWPGILRLLFSPLTLQDHYDGPKVHRMQLLIDLHGTLIAGVQGAPDRRGPE